MGKNVALTALVVCCTFLVLVSHAEGATGCKTLNRGNLIRDCYGDLNSGTCVGNCKTTLSEYKDESDPCVCQHLDELAQNGIDRNKARNLISDCHFRPFPNC